MTADTKPSARDVIARGACHYPSGPSSLNSCCSERYQCEQKADAILTALRDAGKHVVTVPDKDDGTTSSIDERRRFAGGWNACRAAMLSAAEGDAP
jgi:hypothetical protein